MRISIISKCIFVFLFFCFFSLNANAFPKKKHSILKEKVDREKYQNVFELGYHYGYLEYCGFPGSGDTKKYKRIKGLFGYTNWSLFLTFNGVVK